MQEVRKDCYFFQKMNVVTTINFHCSQDYQCGSTSPSNLLDLTQVFQFLHKLHCLYYSPIILEVPIALGMKWLLASRCEHIASSNPASAWPLLLNQCLIQLEGANVSGLIT